MAVVLAGCATRAPQATLANGPGFFSGLWHGFVAPLAFIAQLFVNDIAVYASPNSGGWYDFGFLLGIGGFSSGIFASSNSKSE